jgi:hypothetical protein
VPYRSNAHLSKVSSVRTTRTFCPDLPLCREVSNCSSLYPSRRFSSTSGRLSVFHKLQDLFPKHSYGKITATVQTTWIPIQTRLSIRQVSQFKSRRPDASQLGPDVRASDMEIPCIQSTVRTIILLVWMHEAFIWKYLQRTCDRPDDRAPPSGRDSETGKNLFESLRQLIALLSIRTAHDYRPDDA